MLSWNAGASPWNKLSHCEGFPKRSPQKPIGFPTALEAHPEVKKVFQRALGSPFRELEAALGTRELPGAVNAYLDPWRLILKSQRLTLDWRPGNYLEDEAGTKFS
jgi:hypothetical protein